MRVKEHLAYSPLRRAGLSQWHVVAALALVGAALVFASVFAPRIRSYLRATRDIAAEAKDYLRQRNIKPLDVDMDALLAESAATSIPTLKHPLLNEAAINFELSDHTGRLQTLAEHLEHGPVVLVFYYGYYCNHCVSQLFALEDDIAKLRKLGADVMAISADTPQETAEKFSKYGMFTFPVLSDPGNKIAAAYSIFAPASGSRPERLLHGTFVIDKNGTVRWCHYGEAPFTANATLLVELGKLQGRIASASNGR